MVFKNFFLRFFLSLLLISLYFYISTKDSFLLLYFVSLIYFIIFIEIIMNFKNNKILILLYLLLSYCFFLIIYFSGVNLINFNLMILIIITFDTFSYIVGTIFGKNKILKNISPNKTYEGFLGGLFISFVLSFFYLHIYNIKLNFIFFVFFIVVTTFSFLGDLFQSYFKRINNIKNSSNFLPGHGGFFDRFDSFILVIISYFFLNNLL